MKISLRVMKEGFRKNARNITSLIIIIVFSSSLGLFLSWILINYGFDTQVSVLAALIAAGAVGVNIGVARLTKRALDLTLSMTRPFLNVSSVVYQPPKTIEIIFCNTGALPPDSNTFQALISQTNDFSEPDDVNQLSIPIVHKSSSIFPGEKQQWDISLMQDRAEYISSGNAFYLKIDIKYIYSGKEAITSRVSYLPESNQARKRTPLSILTEGSYWK